MLIVSEIGREQRINHSLALQINFYPSSYDALCHSPQVCATSTHHALLVKLSKTCLLAAHPSVMQMHASPVPLDKVSLSSSRGFLGQKLPLIVKLPLKVGSVASCLWWKRRRPSVLHYTPARFRFPMHCQRFYHGLISISMQVNASF